MGFPNNAFAAVFPVANRVISLSPMSRFWVGAEGAQPECQSFYTVLTMIENRSVGIGIPQ
jgi:hypothetical protein